MNRAVLALWPLLLLSSSTAFRLAPRMSSPANPFQALAERVTGALRQQGASSSFPKAPAAQTDDPGLKVGPMAWKWPPVWPYPPDSFTVKNRADADSDEAPKVTKQMSDALPSLSQAAQEHLSTHYQRFITESDAKVLLLSDADAGWNPTLEGLEGKMDITIHSLDFKTLDGKDLPFTSDSFDYVVLPGGAVRYVTDPREAFREIWRVCRPGGMAFVNFYNSKAAEEQISASDSETAQSAKDNTVKIWQGLNDAQRMWIVGSMFQFSAGTGGGGGDAGWEDLRGYELNDDIYAEPELDENGEVAQTSASVDTNTVYVVQASKQAPPTAVEDPYKAMMYKLALDNKMNEPDRQLVSLRLAKELRIMDDGSTYRKEMVAAEWATTTIDVYEVLKTMGSVLGPDLRSLLAAMIIPHAGPSKPESEKVLKNLKEGLGLEAPGDFWARIGEATKTMPPEDRVYLLGVLAPYFGDSAAEAALEKLPETVERAVDIITSKLYPADADMYYEIENPDAPTRGDCQVLAMDLVLSDYLGVEEGSTNASPPSKHLLPPSEREGFLDWLEAVDEALLKEWSSARKTFKEDALRIHEERLQAQLGEGSEEAEQEAEAGEAGEAGEMALNGATAESSAKDGDVQLNGSTVPKPSDSS